MTADHRVNRLHPLSPLVASAKVFGVLTVIVSVRTVPTYGWTGPLIAAAVALVGALVVSWISWRFTGYQVTERELHVYTGILARSHRVVPFERVQAVDVVRPLLARVAGLAELRLEVVGGGETEAPLAYLTIAEATALRETLLARIGSHSAADEPAPAPGAREPEFFVVDPHDVVLSQLLTPYTLAIPLLAIPPLLGLYFEGLSIAAMMATLLALIGLLQYPVRTIMAEYRFFATRVPGGIRIRHGLVETRTQTIPLDRIQAFRIRRPLVWRPFGWVRVEIDVAGYGNSEEQARATNALIPVARADVADQVLRQLVPGWPVHSSEQLQLAPVPDRVQWLDPGQAPQLGVAIWDDVVICRRGWLTIEEFIVQRARLQSVRVTRGPLQRAFGLATVHCDLAGGKTRPTAAHRDESDALRIALELAHHRSAAPTITKVNAT